MPKERKTPENKKNRSEIEDIKLFLMILLGGWHWILASLLLALAIAFFVNRYTPEEFSATTYILSKKWDRESTTNAMDVIQGGEYFSTSKDITRETMVIKSWTVISDVIRRLNWRVTYSRKGNIRTAELYKSSPVLITYDTTSLVPYEIGFKCTVISGDTFMLSTDNEGWNARINEKKFIFDRQYDIGKFRFTMHLKDKRFSAQSDPDIWFKINNINRLIGEYRGKLIINWVAKGSAVLRLSTVGYVPQKEIDFLKSLSVVLKQLSVQYKNSMADSTIVFINERLHYITDSLMNLGNAIQKMKLANLDLSRGSTTLFQRISELEEKKYELMLANQYLSYLEEYIQQKSKTDVIAPSTIGLDASLMDNLIVQYITLRMEQTVSGSKLIKGTNPMFQVAETEKQEMLDELEKSILESIGTLKASNQFQINAIDEKVILVSNSIRNLLSEEREFVDYKRINQLNEQFFTMLLTKKVEVSIAKASQQPDYEVIDRPTVGGPIVPRISRNYIIAVIIGLGLPVGIIYLINFFNIYVVTKEDLERISDIPLLGVVGHSKTKNLLIVQKKPKSYIAEAFRSLRANMQYFMGNGGSGHVILVTSTQSGEGKTFTSLNLSYVYALSGKKVILMGADMRKPSLKEVFKKIPEFGLSTYLAGLCEYKDICSETLMEGLNVIHGGKVPPNPAELILSPRMSELIEKLKSDFDYIFIDSPPIGLVSDAMELSKMADINLIIVRQGTTRRVPYEQINQMYLDGKLKNASVVFNDFDMNKLPYGYGNKYAYGYGYGYPYENEYFDEEKSEKPWWRKWILRKSVKA